MRTPTVTTTFARPAFCPCAAPVSRHSAPSQSLSIRTHPSLTTTPPGRFVKRLRPATVLAGDLLPVYYPPPHPQPLPTTTSPTASLLSSLTSVASTGAGVLILGFIVFVHESGHFMAARLQGIRVKNFSIGFGPILWSTTPPGSETEFTVRLLPLGGYVAFPDHIKEPQSDPDSDSTDSSDNQTTQQQQKETVFDDDPNLLQNRPVIDRAIVVSAGVVANIILAWAAIFTSISAVGVPTYDVKPGAVISTIVDSSGPAVRDGLRASDVVLALNGRPVAASLDSASQVAEEIRASRGEPLHFSVLRGEETADVTVRPRCCLPDGSSSVGVQLVPNAKVTRIRPVSATQTIARTNSEFVRLFKQTWRGISSLVVNFKSSSQNLSGPIGVVSMGADLARNDTAALFTFCAVISINLAIINSLPLPALDGGQMTFLIIEALRGTPVSLKVQDAVNRTALLALLAFSGALFLGDLERLNLVGALQKLIG